MKNSWKLAAFALLAAVQLGVPAHLIQRQQQTLAHGAEYRFKTAPVDPADPFRGRYVALNFTAACAPLPSPGEPDGRHESKWFALLATDGEGYARIADLSRERPTDGDYIQVRSQPSGGCAGGGGRLEFPFNRFYLPEQMAPQAEAAYMASNRRRTALPAPAEGTEPPDPRVPAYARVRVLDGNAALQELVLDGLPLREFLERERAARGEGANP
ncbi:MAG TPA: GDYXXLXY domain-containing protein [Solimonas sp.]|nr:GDYXXLXY domain-containing protein [Solimonas sp.]